MSADDTIGVLITAAPDGRGVEYRVACAQAIENIFWDPDFGQRDCACNSEELDGLNTESVIEVFGDAKVFSDRYEALTYANYLDNGDWPSEYGVHAYDYSHVPFPIAASPA